MQNLHFRLRVCVCELCIGIRNKFSFPQHSTAAPREGKNFFLLMKSSRGKYSFNKIRASERERECVGEKADDSHMGA